MSKFKKNTDLAGLVKISGIFALFFSICFAGYQAGKIEGYRNGQIDALNGVMKYERDSINGKAVYWMPEKQGSLFVK